MLIDKDVRQEVTEQMSEFCSLTVVQADLKAQPVWHQQLNQVLDQLG